VADTRLRRVTREFHQEGTGLLFKLHWRQATAGA
jgi:hypothetical protein